MLPLFDERSCDEPLSQLEVLVVDCQATVASPRGHLLELGWARVRSADIHPTARFIRLPRGERIPPAVTRVTGIAETMLRDGVERQVAWRELAGDAACLTLQPAPTVVHFARFEEPYLRSLAGGAPSLDVVCTHAIARRLLPDLPRCTLRALTGYFGRAVGGLRRSAEHVEATAFIWRALVRMLDDEGVSTWNALHDWLAAPGGRTTRTRRVWPMPRDVRLSLPDAPGVYRLLRTNGDVVYVGKASSLRHRVNSHFRKQHGVPERTLEMLSQARALSFDVTPSALEAALLEPDEIKRHAPPYNVALTEDRHVWFTPPDFSARSPQASRDCRVGPFPSAQALDQFAALARSSAAALGTGRWAPAEAIFNAGYARLCAVHPELMREDLAAHTRLLRVGSRLWREGRRDCDVSSDDATGKGRGTIVWTPEHVQLSLERMVLRAAVARRRARWLTRLVDAAVMWSEPGAIGARLIVIENGDIVDRAAVESNVDPPIPPGYRRSIAARREALAVGRFDRLRVLTTELKRLVSEGAPAAVRFGRGPALAGARLAYALSRV